MSDFKYYDLIDNDIINGKNITVSVWMGGCPHRCPHCHNSELWEKSNDKSLSIDRLNDLLNKNHIKRNLSILGGEPLSSENIDNTNLLGRYFNMMYPDRKLYLWTGYTYEELLEKGSPYTDCFEWANYIIDGRFENDKRNITLPLRGSSNQRILERGIDF